MWFVYALLSAFAASLVAIFAKLGMKQIDVIAATTIRSLIMSIVLIIISILCKKCNMAVLRPIITQDGLLILLSALAGAFSWLFYFAALNMGLVSRVTAVDRLSFVFVIVLSVLVLGEPLKLQAIAGIILTVGGIYLISFS